MLGLIVHEAIKILNQNMMFLLILCYQQLVQNILITLFRYVNRVKLFVFTAENVDINAVLLLYFTIMFGSNRKLNTLIIQLLYPFSCPIF